MRLFWAVTAAAALALCGTTPGNASTDPMDDGDVAIGVGVICNTPEQAERLVGLRVDGTDVDHAISLVNDEAHDPRACGVAAVAFMSDKMVGMKNVQGKLVQIMRINVVAAFDGEQWSSVPTMTQYALLEPDGYEV